MPYTVLGPHTNSDRPVASRVGLFGPVGTFKTTSIVETWPRKAHGGEKLVILSCPGEKGWETIPRNDPDLVPLIWEIEDMEKVSPHQVIKDVESAIAQAVSGAFGPVTTFALDGAHKLYPWYFERAFKDKLDNPPKNWDGDEEKMVGPAYGQSHRDFGKILAKLSAARIPYLVCTFWDSEERDDPKDKRRDAPTHIFPDLPGKMAKNVVGEFGAMLYCETTLPDLQGRSSGAWLTRREGRVWGASIKVPPVVAKQIPVRFPQHFEVLQRYMSGDAVGAADLTKTLQGPRPAPIPTIPRQKYHT